MNETVRRFCRWSISGADTRQKQRDRPARFLGSRPRHRRYPQRYRERPPSAVPPPIWRSRSCTTPSIATCRLLRATRAAVPVARRWSRRRTSFARTARSSACSASTPIFRPCATSVPWPSSLWPALTPLPHAPSPPHRGRKPFGVHAGAHRPQYFRAAERSRAGCDVAWSKRPRGSHSPPQRQRSVHAQGRRSLRRHRAGHLGAQRLPLPAKSPQGRLTR